jgi:uncharacterized protein (TIGR00661 family)
LKKNILVAPLNWGLGHASRCIPIIKALEKNGFNPIIASDGQALLLLQKEFPHLLSTELPSYKIEYPKEDESFKWKFLKQLPKIFKAVRAEKKKIKHLITHYNIQGLISDNRWGVRNKKIPCVYITHQITVLSGRTTLLSSKLHQYFVKKFTECWVPDVQGKSNLSGKLGHPKNTKLNLKYIGPLSRFEKKEVPLLYDLLIVLSGPEPQRSLLEEKLKTEIKNYTEKVIFIKGIVEKAQHTEQYGNVTFYNFMTTDELENAINQSKLILCRSGYSTIMDLSKLDKKAFFIPTPGQYEQVYLAQKFNYYRQVPYASQRKFDIEDLHLTRNYSGMPMIIKEPDWGELFKLFDGE